MGSQLHLHTAEDKIQIHLYTTAGNKNTIMLTHYMLSSHSISLSVKSWYCIKTAKHTIMQTMLYNSPGTL